MTELLILGGTTEARLLCEEVYALGIPATVSLAGVTTRPNVLRLPIRSGGFGGPEGLCDWLRAHHIKAVIDATHPFARQMPWNARQACEGVGIPRLRLMRPGFARSERWHTASDLSEALKPIPAGKRVLLTTGQNDLGGIGERADLPILLRTIEPVGELPDHVTAILIRPPLNWEAECAMLQDHRIDVLVAKDSGGVTAPKLEAANALGVRVTLIERPPQPPGPCVTSVADAVAWLRDVVGIGP